MKTSFLTALVIVFAVYTCVHFSWLTPSDDSWTAHDRGWDKPSYEVTVMQGQYVILIREKAFQVGRHSRNNVNFQPSNDTTGDDQELDPSFLTDDFEVDLLFAQHFWDKKINFQPSNDTTGDNQEIGGLIDELLRDDDDDVNFQPSNDTTEDDQEIGGLRTPDAVDLIDSLCRDYDPNGIDMPRVASDGELADYNFCWFQPSDDSWAAQDRVDDRSGCEIIVIRDQQADENEPSTSNGIRQHSDCNKRHPEEYEPAIRSNAAAQAMQSSAKWEAVNRCRAKQSCEKRITKQKLEFYTEWFPKFITELSTCSNPKHGTFLSDYLGEHRRLMLQLEEQLRNDIIERTAEIVTEAANLRTEGVEVDPHDPSLTHHLRRWCSTEDPTAQSQADSVPPEMHNAWVTRVQRRIDELTAIYANLNTVTHENFNRQSTARQPVATRHLIQQSIQELVAEIMRLRQSGAAITRQIRKEENEMQAIEEKMKRRQEDDEDDGAPDHKKKK